MRIMEHLLVTHQSLARVIYPFFYSKEGLAGGVSYPYASHMGMCRCERYYFQRVKSGIMKINQTVLVGKNSV